MWHSGRCRGLRGPRMTADSVWWGGLAELPDGALGGVGQVDAELVELGADLVGAGPVLVLAGLGAVGDKVLDGPLLLAGQVGEGAAPFQVGRGQGGQAQAEQGVGGRDDRDRKSVV